MLIISLWTSLLGFTEPIFVPAYWSPPSLFDLAHRTGFDIESLIFAFAAGGIVFSLYSAIFHKIERKISSNHHSYRHRFHRAIWWSVPVLIIFFFFSTNLNPIYDFIIAGTIGGLLAAYCRPDLTKKMFISAVLFFILYYFYFLVLIAAYPGYVRQVWNLENLSGVLVTGIPLEELLFAIILGFYWSSVYEHFTWRRLKNL
ncbi:MAG: lycopene cyclase domain-containing protein [Patescibacteria group bacterium]